MKNCCFTGHRNVKVTARLINNISETICSLIETHGITEYYSGGAVGWDMLCEKVVLSLKEKYPFIHLHLILPCPPEIQTELWTQTDKDSYYNILKKADSIKVISLKYYKGCMKKRNEALVNIADYCVCYYDEKRTMSGTGQTVRLSKKRGIEVINLF